MGGYNWIGGIGWVYWEGFCFIDCWVLRGGNKRDVKYVVIMIS